MISIDTNILVRLFTNDDINQAKKAAYLLNNNLIYITKSVLLETEWVLRYAYKIDRKTITGIFKKLMEFSNANFEDEHTISKALLWAEQGFEFADALHLASSNKTNKFATFDKKLRNKMKKVNPTIYAIAP